MLLKSRISMVAMILSVFAFAACSDDKPKTEEPATSGAKVDAPAPPPETGGTVSTEPVYFGFDDYSLSSTAQSTLGSLADSLKKGGAMVQIEGHCDERGSIEYNLALGERRANSVKNYLVQVGVDGSRLSTISYGEEKPAAEGHSESTWAKNRRAEFVVTKQ